MMNSSEGINYTDVENIVYDPVDVGTTPSIIFLIILLVIGTVANGHVFGIFLFRYNRKSTYVTFVLALALIDLLVCVIDLPLEILDLGYPYDFYSEPGCKLFKFISAALILSSVLTLTLLSRDRFKRICHPLSPQWSNSTCRRYIAGGIVSSVILAAPVFYVQGLHAVKLPDGRVVQKCFFEDDIDESLNPPLIHLSVLYILFFVCVLVLIVSYAYIMIVIYHRRKSFHQAGKMNERSVSNLNSSQQSKSKTQSKGTTCASDNEKFENTESNSKENYSQNEWTRQKSYEISTVQNAMEFYKIKSLQVVPKIRTDKKVVASSNRSTIILFIITVIFIVVYLPYLVLGVFLCVVENFKANMSVLELSVYRLSMRLMFLNNVVNCFVYGIFDSRFNRACRDMYKKLFKFS